MEILIGLTITVMLLPMNLCPCKQVQLACSTDGILQIWILNMINRWIKKGIPLGEGREKYSQIVWDVI